MSDPVQMLNLKQVMKITTLSKSTIYALIHEKKFPRQVRLTPGGSVAWVQSEIHAWIEERMHERD